MFAQRHTFYDVFLLLLRRNEEENMFSFLVKCVQAARKHAPCACVERRTSEALTRLRARVAASSCACWPTSQSEVREPRDTLRLIQKHRG